MSPTLTWLGQSSFLIDTESTRLLIDPFFSEHQARRYAPLPVAPFATGIDRILITHEHLDHLDPESLRAIALHSPDAIVVAPSPLRSLVKDMPFEGVGRGDRLTLPGGGRLAVVPAIHALHPKDGYSEGERFVGYVLELEGIAIYHAGDTIDGEPLSASLEEVDVDVALLPVNGRTPERERRGIAGNLDAEEAVALAVECGARVLVPIHWDLFDGNTERAGAASDAADTANAPVHVLTLRRGLPWAVALPP
jgi:L-ascorbate metabolism protein UlaG (beta-lactamase superfamily)